MTEFLKVYYHRLGCNNILELLKMFEAMDMASFGAKITQDVLFLVGEGYVLVGFKEADWAEN